MGATMMTRWVLISLVLICTGWLLPSHLMAQPIPRPGVYNVVVESQWGSDGILIGGEPYTLTAEAQILDIDGRPTGIERIQFPTDAKVRLYVGPDGKGNVSYLKVEVFPR